MFPEKWRNESAADRVLRILLGVVAGVIGYTIAGGALQIVLYVVAAIAVFTGLTGFCILYLPFRINTRRL